MPGSASLLAFVAAALVVLLIPGPGVLLHRLFTDGVIVNVLNPKIAVFFLAFLPQFVEPRRGPIPQQVLFLGLLYVALALFTDGAYACLTGSLRRWLGSRVVKGPMPRYASGVVYIGLGVSTALADQD